MPSLNTYLRKTNEIELKIELSSLENHRPKGKRQKKMDER